MMNQALSNKLLAIFCITISQLCFVYTANAAEEKPPEKTRKTQAIRADVFDKLSKAQEAQEEGDIEAAFKYLDALKERSGKKELKPYEKAQLWNFYAYAYLLKEDYPKAISSFQKVLAQPDLPEGLQISTQFTLAQLYMASGEVKKAIHMLEEWFRVAENPSPDAFVLLAQAYIQDKRIEDALKPLLSAFKEAKKQGKQEKENWYALLQYIYSEKQQYKKQAEILRVLVSKWPKKQYWLSLFGVYSELEDERQQLNVLETAYVQGMLDQKGYLITLAQLLAANSMPYKAAKVMEKGIADNIIERDAKNLERLGEYWRLSQEVDKALPYLVEAAELAEDGKPGLRLAYLYMSLYQYDKAAQQIKSALSKGGLRRPVDAQIQMGTALYYAQKYQQAIRVFESLAKLSREKEMKKQSEQVQQWLKIIKSEVKRSEEIKAFLAS